MKLAELFVEITGRNTKLYKSLEADQKHLLAWGIAAGRAAGKKLGENISKFLGGMLKDAMERDKTGLLKAGVATGVLLGNEIRATTRSVLGKLFHGQENHPEHRKGLTAWGVAMGTFAGNVFADAFRQAVGSLLGTLGTIRDMFRDGLSRAMDMEEVLAQFNGTFAKYRQPILDFANQMSRAYGQSKREILEGATDIMRDLTNAGMSKEAAAKKAEEMVRMASEMSRKSPGTKVGDNLHDIQAAIVGASRGLRWQGIEFPEQALRLKALEMFNKSPEFLKSWEEKLVRAEVMAGKVRARLAGMGDGMQRPAGQMEMFWGRWESFVGRLGKAVLPVWETAMRAVNRLLDEQGKTLDWIIGQVGKVADRVKEWVKPLALIGKEGVDVWKLYESAASDAFQNIKQVAINIFSDLAAFLGDLFGQVGRDIGAKLWNGLGDLWTGPHSNAISRQVAAMLGMGEHMATPGIHPNLGLLGDAFRNLPGVSKETRERMEALNKILKDAGLGGIGTPTDEEHRKPTQEPPGGEETTKPVTAQHHDLAQWAKTLQEKILGQNSQAQIADNTKRGADAQVKTAEGIIQLNTMLGGGAMLPGVAV